MSSAVALGAFGAVANGFTIVSALTGSGPDAVGHITNRKRTTDIIAERIKLINADVDWVMGILNTYGQQLTEAELSSIVKIGLFNMFGRRCKSDLNMDYKFRIRNLKLFKKGVSDKVMVIHIRDMNEGSNASSSATGTPGSRTYPPSTTDSMISLLLVHGHSPRTSPTGQVPGVQPSGASGNAGTPLQRWTTTDTNSSLSAKPLVHN
ncbi:hypothetical protein B0H14DRAFT_3034221 [Mycena olivaceomarginata]|nr:hypothetical protein B0H14DRAFT_3034221 [Mycena olivaceomarginata]